MEGQNCIRRFKNEVRNIPFPEKFTFPFYYEPHPLVKLAAKELQADIANREWNHNFGLDGNPEGLVIGKMFGVLVVTDVQGKLGYLAAFSGKLADANHHHGFVPPVFDMLHINSYYKEGEAEISAINKEIERLEQVPELALRQAQLASAKQEADTTIQNLKASIRSGKSQRKKLRQEAETWPTDKKEAYLHQLSQQSIKEQYTLKDTVQLWRKNVTTAEKNLALLSDHLDALKADRKAKSGLLQRRLFTDYTFLNAKGETRSLLSIFQEKEIDSPPAGSGECAAPKLLQYAYKNNLQPLALGEFWWGASPKSEVRVHQQFYPSCRGKCEPILGHMLQGISVDANPMLTNPAEGKEFSVVYEDDVLLVINKPAEFLSVPGKVLYDSVLTRLEGLYPDATGPLLVHRLDMSTSGLLLAAKRKDVHKKLQAQFLKRTVSKRYEALLEGQINAPSGEIRLPLRVDLDNRPQQLVCSTYGKAAVTRWEKIADIDGRSLLNLYPITGRTHQLRVHCAHKDGLGTPIIGDDLYGTRANRLHLHAAYLKFKHPITKEDVEIYIPSGFEKLI